MQSARAPLYSQSYDQSARAALSRTLATLLSFVLCLICLLIFPFRVVGMAVLIGIIAVVLALVRRSEDIIAAAITTAVVMEVAGITPKNALGTATQPYCVPGHPQDAAGRGSSLRAHHGY
jgi:uncharacterized membrane protein YccC